MPERDSSEDALRLGRQVASTVADMYSEGDPELIAFSSLLDAESTEELTRRDGVRDVVVGQELEIPYVTFRYQVKAVSRDGIVDDRRTTER